jgi:hypothetical protein
MRKEASVGVERCDLRTYAAAAITCQSPLMCLLRDTSGHPASAYFAARPLTAQDFAELSKTKLTMPVLSIAGEKASAATLNAEMKRSRPMPPSSP